MRNNNRGFIVDRSVAVIVVVKVVALDNLGLVVAASVGKVLVVLGQLSGHGVHSRSVRLYDHLLRRRGTSPEKILAILSISIRCIDRLFQYYNVPG